MKTTGDESGIGTKGHEWPEQTTETMPRTLKQKQLLQQQQQQDITA